MRFLKVVFPVSGVETYLWVPPLVAFFLAFFGVMGGVTGAFLLLPFQFSVLGYTAPGVSATNLFYNLLTIPPALWRYRREGRFHRPLTLLMIAGTVPGMFWGYLGRLTFFRHPERFRLLIAGVLFYLALRLLKDLLSEKKPSPRSGEIEMVSLDWRRLVFRFGGEVFEVPVLFTWGISFLVGVVGGAYGIGGGAVLAPFLVSILKLPVHAVAAATLATTLAASLAGVLFYSFGPGAGPDTRPDILLGTLFGLGGLVGAYLGARLQRRVPARPIKWGLLLALTILCLKICFDVWH